MANELLEKIPAEKRWALTSKFLSSIHVIQGEKITAPIIGKGEDIVAPVKGAETWTEINVQIFGGFFKWWWPRLQEMFNIQVENAEDAVKFLYVTTALQSGPEWEFETHEVTRERAVVKVNKCPWWERYTENEIRPEFIPCLPTCDEEIEEGIKAVNPSIRIKLTKARPRGDTYCEWVYKLKEE
jgi:hypothetical protein